MRTVICQFRFHPDLQIDVGPPADYQARIRKEFPGYEEQVETRQSGIDLPPELMAAIQSQVPSKRIHCFVSEDEMSKVTLTRDSLALTTTSYSRWENFANLVDGPLGALIDVYAPSVFTRIGLRYVNVISRSEIGEGNTPWAELIASPIAAELTSPELAEAILTSVNQLTIQLPDDKGIVMLQHGLGTFGEPPDRSYVIDSDSYTENCDPANALQRLNEFHTNAGNLFRWCITDRLRDALLAAPV
ncbi:MAG: TIGR04255 family protein [Armatimonadetes bacterium]|nr:TIGR04255 family protein [Armatimonadota bacterium]